MPGHINEHTAEIRHATQNKYTEFESFNNTNRSDFTFSSSSLDKSDIKLIKPLLVKLAQHNRSEANLSTKSQGQSTDRIFDQSLCEVAELAIANVGMDTDTVGLSRMRALMIHIARNFDDFADIAEYLSNYPTDTLKKFGLPTAEHKSTYRKAAKNLKNEGKHEKLVDACYHAAHALFWTGIAIPSDVKKHYNLSVDDGPAASDFSPAARDLALYNLVADLLDIVTRHLDFKRDASNCRSIDTVPGIFAYIADHEMSIETFQKTARHIFDIENAFAGSTVRTHIDNLSISYIENMFDNINQDLFGYLLTQDTISDAVIASYDLTSMGSIDIHEYDERYKTEDGDWTFSSLSLTDPLIDFAYGFRILKTKEQRAKVLRELLRNLKSDSEIKLFFADRGFDGHLDFKACHDLIPQSWLIQAQDDSNTSGEVSDFDRLKEEIGAGKTGSIESNRYNEFNSPLNLIGYSVDSDHPNMPEMRAFYTGMAMPSDNDKEKCLITNLNYIYNQRSKIEPIFRMMKNKFDVYSDTDKPNRKTFYFNMSAIFYNIYKIVSTTPSPIMGLDINTSQKEILKVIQLLSFGAPAQSKAYKYHQEAFDAD